MGRFAVLIALVAAAVPTPAGTAGNFTRMDHHDLHCIDPHCNHAVLRAQRQLLPRKL
jgi:hypothetical protein